MARKEKRKARKKLAPIVDVIEPLPLDILGTKDDPCFGKLNDPRNEVCQRCGDSEICAIAMGQSNHVLRAAIEAKQPMKDKEELEIKPDKTPLEYKKDIKARWKEMIKQGQGDEEELVLDTYNTWGKFGFSQPRLRKLLKAWADKSEYINRKSNKYTWKKSQ